MPKGHRGSGGYIGASGTGTTGGVFSARTQQILVSSNSWLPLGSAANPASSAAALVASGNTTSGLYYINLPTVGVTQVYCDLSTQGGGWMLAMRLDSNLGTGTTRHYFDPTWWENAASYSAAPSNARTTGEVKTAVYGYYPHTEIMLEYGYGASAFASTAIARYTQPTAGNSPSQIGTTLAAKQNSTSAYHENGGRTWNGYTTSGYRWTKAASTDNTFFPNAYLHMNVGTHVDGGASNDVFRFWYNSIPDTTTGADTCNQIGGWGMSGDYAFSGAPVGQSFAWDAGNASATISPPTTSTGGFGCQWNSQRAAAGTSGKNFLGNTATQVSSNYYTNGVGLIWVR